MRVLIAGLRPRRSWPGLRGGVGSTRAGARTGRLPGAERILDLLDRARIVDDIDYHPGYDRDCDPGRLRLRGAVDRRPRRPEGAQRLHHPRGRPAPADEGHRDAVGLGCRIYEARLRDPYSGERMTWRDDGYYISIDHIYPLARAWHGGAWAWPAAQADHLRQRRPPRAARRLRARQPGQGGRRPGRVAAAVAALALRLRTPLRPRGRGVGPAPHHGRRGRRTTRRAVLLNLLPAQSSSQSRRGPVAASCSSADIRLEAHSESTAVTARVARMTTSESQIGMSGAHADVLAAVDERAARSRAWRAGSASRR